MKKILLMAAFSCLAVSLWGEDLTATQTNGSTFSSGTRPSPVSKTPTRVEKLKPQPTGVIYEMSRDGFVVINPAAPKDFGYGEKYLTTNPFPAGTLSQDNNSSEAKREFGGIKLIGAEF